MKKVTAKQAMRNFRHNQVRQTIATTPICNMTEGSRKFMQFEIGMIRVIRHKKDASIKIMNAEYIGVERDENANLMLVFAQGKKYNYVPLDAIADYTFTND